MELYIRIVDGKPFEHPILADNFFQAFPDVDTDNLPPEFARFVRVQAPMPSPYQKNLTVSYQLIDGAYTDVFSFEQMTAEEISVRQQVERNRWTAMNGFSSWVLNETTCVFEAPTPKPNDGKSYYWNEEQLAWIEMT